jgi:hypothetical protein
MILGARREWLIASFPDVVVSFRLFCGPRSGGWPLIAQGETFCPRSASQQLIAGAALAWRHNLCHIPPVY